MSTEQMVFQPQSRTVRHVFLRRLWRQRKSLRDIGTLSASLCTSVARLLWVLL